MEDDNFTSMSELRWITVWGKQLLFQKNLGIPIMDRTMSTKLQLTESYILETIGELIEVKESLPSSFNPRKAGKEFDRGDLENEISDVFIHLINLCLVWNIVPNGVLANIEDRQKRNFKRQEDLNNAASKYDSKEED